MRLKTTSASAAIGLILLACPAADGSAGGEGIDPALRRAEDWLVAVRVDPFAGSVPAFRRFVLEVEAWHRLWALAPTEAERSRLTGEVRPRLQAALDRAGLKEILAMPEGNEAFSEMAVLADRCRTHGFDPGPIAEALAANRAALRAEVESAPASAQAVYAAYLEAAGSPIRLKGEEILARGMLRLRPREIDLTLADVYYLTHEIFARSDYALSKLRGLAPEEEAYLLRVLPFFALFYARLGKIDILGEILTFLHAAGMRDTHAYREGIRTLLERQEPDGSFRDAGAGPARPDRSDRLHPTLNAITALALERRSAPSRAQSR